MVAKSRKNARQPVAEVLVQPALKVNADKVKAVIDSLPQKCNRWACLPSQVWVTLFQSPVQFTIKWKSGWIDKAPAPVTAPRQPLKGFKFTAGSWDNTVPDSKGGASYVSMAINLPGELRLAIDHIAASIVAGDSHSSSRAVRFYALIGLLDAIDDQIESIEVWKRHGASMVPWKVEKDVLDFIETGKQTISAYEAIWAASKGLQVNYPDPGQGRNPQRKVRDYGQNAEQPAI